MTDDPLEKLYVTEEQAKEFVAASLAKHIKALPPQELALFQKEFCRRKDVSDLAAMLKRCEWTHYDGLCPVCQNDVTDGHAPDCELVALLRRCET